MTTFEPGRERRLHPRLARRGPRARRCGRAGPAPSMTDGFEVFVQLVIAAITTCAVVELEVRRRRVVTSTAGARCLVATARGRRSAGALGRPWSRPRPGSSSPAGRWPGTTRGGAAGRRSSPTPFVVGDVAGQRLAERRLRVGAAPRGPAGASGRRARHDVAEVELERVGERRLLGVLVVPEALLLGVGLDERDLLGRAAGELEVAQRLGVDREDRARRAELRATCCRSSRGRRAAGAETPGP